MITISKRSKEGLLINKKDAKKEIDYQLIKLLLLNLKRAGLITAEEAELARKRAQKQIKPLIGSLD